MCDLPVFVACLNGLLCFQVLAGFNSGVRVGLNFDRMVKTPAQTLFSSVSDMTVVRRRDLMQF